MQVGCSPGGGSGAAAGGGGGAGSVSRSGSGSVDVGGDDGGSVIELPRSSRIAPSSGMLAGRLDLYDVLSGGSGRGGAGGNGGGGGAATTNLGYASVVTDRLDTVDVPPLIVSAAHTHTCTRCRLPYFRV